MDINFAKNQLKKHLEKRGIVDQELENDILLIFGLINPNKPDCEHRSTSSWGNSCTCLGCGIEWIKDED